MAEWWFNSGVNMLKGVAGDTDNLLRLTDVEIIDFLRHFPDARESFNRLVPTMLVEERARLELLAATSGKYLQPDYKQVEDNFQASQNRAGVRTAGPRAGRRIGGNN